MNKTILACFQDDQFSFIFEPLVSELLMQACTCMDLRLPMAAHLPFVYWSHFAKEKFKFKTQVFLRGFQLPDSYVWFLVSSQICRLLIKIVSFVIGL